MQTPQIVTVKMKKIQELLHQYLRREAKVTVQQKVILLKWISFQPCQIPLFQSSIYSVTFFQAIGGIHEELSDERLGDLSPMEPSHTLIDMNPNSSVTGLLNPVTVTSSPRGTIITTSKGTGLITTTNHRGTGIIPSTPNLQLVSPVTVTPRFTANYSITPKERINFQNIITLHNQGEN